MYSHSAIYPGTFDPITFGHLDIIKRAALLFDKIIIGVIEKPLKSQFLFTIDERLEMIKNSTTDIKNIEIETFDGLLVDYAQNKKVNLIIRGLRAITDFEYEFQMALTNKKLANNIETMFMMTNEKYSYLSSSVVKEIAKFNGDISEFAPEFVIKKLKNKFKTI